MSDHGVSHILVPVDVEAPEVSEKALLRAIAMARAEGARLTLFHVAAAWREDMAEVPRETLDALEAILAREASGIDAQVVSKSGGSISGRIIEAVRELGCDLVVMASHNPRLSDYLIGSNAAHVTLHAPVSVMVVR